MNRIDKKLANLKSQNKKGLVSFAIAGDPTIEESEAVFKSLISSGSDIIEIGMPFSDPMADGPTIQKGDIRALKNDISLDDIFALVARIREQDNETPIILMGYFNPCYKYGYEKFCKEAAKVGVDALIIVDLPYEENLKYLDLYKENNLHFINLLSPNSPKDRIEKILSVASGFIYYVSVTAPTGTKEPEIGQIKNKVQEIKNIKDIAVAVGFGISNKDQAKQISQISDLIVIGSRYLKFIEENAGVGAIEGFNSEIKGEI